MAVAHASLRVELGIGTLESRSPATGAVLGKVPILGENEVNAAVARARDAAERWGALEHAERREHLFAWRREMARRVDDIVEIVHEENGKPRLDAIGELFVALGFLGHAARRAEQVLRPRAVSSGVLLGYRGTVSYHPFGVVGVIGPWNFPLMTPMGSIASALAAGNAVVFKPSELAPLSGRLFAETAAAAIPIPDVLQVITGDGRTGHALARAPIDKLAFTGSTATGRKVMAAAAERLTPVVMELGGKDPLIVAPDADVEKAAEAAVFGSLANAGQACVSVERVYAVSTVYDRFVDCVVKRAKRVRAGSDEGAQIGPITRPEQVDVIRDQLEDAIRKGGRVLLGGADGISGNFVPATVLVDVTDDMKVMREETFGPVLPIARVDSVEEAIRRANASPYGLGASVFARYEAREIAARLRAGATAINSVWTYLLLPSLPFGGVGESGFGRIHGDEGLREFARSKSTTEERVPMPFSLTTFRTTKNAYGTVRSAVRALFGSGLVDRVDDAIRWLMPS